MSSDKPIIIIYMGGLILGVNTLYRLFCFFKPFPMVGKGLKGHCLAKCTSIVVTRSVTTGYIYMYIQCISY